jgi:hypothetical protein
MPRFVVLYHEPSTGMNRPAHWDFMLESGDRLRTWALAGPPQLEHDIEAERLPDHRLIYLTYEGPVSGDRGVVSRWDEGMYETNWENDHEWNITLHGGVLNCVANLRCSPSELQRWRVNFRSLGTVDR